MLSGPLYPPCLKLNTACFTSTFSTDNCSNYLIFAAVFSRLVWGNRVLYSSLQYLAPLPRTALLSVSSSPFWLSLTFCCVFERVFSSESCGLFDFVFLYSFLDLLALIGETLFFRFIFLLFAHLHCSTPSKMSAKSLLNSFLCHRGLRWNCTPRFSSCSCPAYLQLKPPASSLISLSSRFNAANFLYIFFISLVPLKPKRLLGSAVSRGRTWS